MPLARTAATCSGSIRGASESSLSALSPKFSGQANKSRLFVTKIQYRRRAGPARLRPPTWLALSMVLTGIGLTLGLFTAILVASCERDLSVGAYAGFLAMSLAFTWTAAGILSLRDKLSRRLKTGSLNQKG